MRPGLLWLACGLLALAPACNRGKNASHSPPPEVAAPSAGQPLVTFITPTGEVPVLVEVARNPEARAKGLMDRKQLEPMHGMVFVFAEEKDHPFWMKNTLIPLDMIFIGADRAVVGIVANAEPLNERLLSVDQPSRYVVEVVGGFAAQHQLTVGTRVTFENVPNLDPN